MNYEQALTDLNSIQDTIERHCPDPGALEPFHRVRCQLLDGIQRLNAVEQVAQHLYPYKPMKKKNVELSMALHSILDRINN